MAVAGHRDRLVAACSEVVQERGYGATAVAHVIAAAGVSRRTFYEHFSDKEACFLAAYDLEIGRLRERVFAAFEAPRGWPERLRAGLGALFAALAEEPGLARLLMVEPLAAGPPISQHHRRQLASFTALFEGARAPGQVGPPVGTEEAVMAGIVSLLTRRIAAGRAAELPGLLPGLLETALAPFRGPVAAEKLARDS